LILIGVFSTTETRRYTDFFELLNHGATEGHGEIFYDKSERTGSGEMKIRFGPARIIYTKQASL